MSELTEYDVAYIAREEARAVAADLWVDIEALKRDVDRLAVAIRTLAARLPGKE